MSIEAEYYLQVANEYVRESRECQVKLYIVVYSIILYHFMSNIQLFSFVTNLIRVYGNQIINF